MEMFSELYKFVSANPLLAFICCALMWMLGRKSVGSPATTSRPAVKKVLVDVQLGNVAQLNLENSDETKTIVLEDKEVFERIKTLVSEGRKIDAIKEFRHATGSDLVTAKRVVEELTRALNL